MTIRTMSSLPRRAKCARCTPSFAWAAPAAMLLALAACAPTTKIMSQWRDATDESPPMTKVAVVAAKKDATRKRIWEDAFVRELRKVGVPGIAAYTVFEGDIVDTVAARKFVLDGGYDGVFVIRSGGIDTRTTIIPGTTRIEAVDTVYDPLWHQFRTIYEQTRTPDIEETEKIYSNEITVYRPNPDPQKKSRLVWSGTTESVDPKSSQEASAATAVQVVKELVSLGVLPKGAAPADPFATEPASSADDE